MTSAERKIVDWMREGDRALYRCPWDSSPTAPYGAGSPWKRVANRKQVMRLISAGIIEFYACHPPDLRVMLVQK